MSHVESAIMAPPLIARVEELLDALKDDMTGPELRTRRQALGLTQRALAERLGIPWNTLARWERGELRIEHARLLDLALEALERREEAMDRA